MEKKYTENQLKKYLQLKSELINSINEYVHKKCSINQVKKAMGRLESLPEGIQREFKFNKDGLERFVRFLEQN